MAKTFVLSDESLNSYGFWVLTAGIGLTLFKKNPIMLWNHNRAWRGTTDEVLPIGKWENIRIENGQLKADAVFDQNDEFAKKIEAKVEAGIINMCSIGIDVLTYSEDKAYLKQGQTRQTVVKCKLREVSICDIGSNENALALYDADGNFVNLSSGAENPVKLLSTKNTKKMDKISLKLGLQETATEGDILSAIQELSNRATSALVLSAETCTKLGIDPKATDTVSVETAVTNLCNRAEKAEKTLADGAETKCVALVDGAIASGKITADLKDTYLGMARTDYDGTEKALSAIPAKENLAQQANLTGFQEGDAWKKRMDEIRKGGK
jgi:HK97 family phage prohead protease